MSNESNPQDTGALLERNTKIPPMAESLARSLQASLTQNAPEDYINVPNNSSSVTPSMALPQLKGLTYDQGKPPLAVLPWAAIRELAQVQAYGHKKYKDFNNYRKGIEVSRNLSCALRHIADYMDGHDTDPESGLSPLAHALCRIAFVLQNINDHTEIDDRYKKPK